MINGDGKIIPETIFRERSETREKNKREDIKKEFRGLIRHVYKEETQS